jgi:hypothetical protein
MAIFSWNATLTIFQAKAHSYSTSIIITFCRDSESIETVHAVTVLQRVLWSSNHLHVSRHLGICFLSLYASAAFLWWNQMFLYVRRFPSEYALGPPKSFLFRLSSPQLAVYRVFHKELYNGIPNVTVWRLLRKRLYLKTYKLSIVQHLTISTRQHLEYHCTALLETRCITSGSYTEP